MYFAALLSIAATTAIATPVPNGPAWTAADRTTTSCDPSSNKYIPVSEASDLAEQACVAIMDKCAFPKKVDSDTVCAAVLDWPLTATKTISMNSTVLNAAGDSLSNVHPVFTVVPAARPTSSASDMGNDVTWTAGDCVGYFDQLLSQKAPSGCMTSTGASAGNLTVGGTSSLKDTVFSVSFPESN